MKTDNENKNKSRIAVPIFVVFSFLFLFGWRYLNLPHNTSLEFVIRSIAITTLSILATWVVMKVFYR